MWTATERILGPATVTEATGESIRLALPEGEREAVLALATPYRPEKGDVVLVIGDEDLYVIGVLSGRGASRLAVDGDLDIEATGAVRIRAGREVSMNAPDVAVKAGRLELVAERFLGRFVRVYEWVRETLKTSAGRIRTNTREGVAIRAERITAFGEKDVKINGKQIHLG